MKISEGPMLFEITHLPTEEDVREEFEKLKILLAGRRLTSALQAYVFDELVHLLTKKIEIKSTRVGP